MTYVPKSSVSCGAAAALAAVVAFASPSPAQASECAQQWSRVADFLVDARNGEPLAPAISHSLADGGCRVNGIELPLDGRAKLAIKSISWSGEDMDRFVADGLPPRSLTIGIAGISRKSPMGLPGVDQDLDRILSTLSVDLSLVASWDEDKRVASLDLLTIGTQQGDYLTAQAIAENVDFGSKAKMQMSAGGFSIPSARITFGTVGTFEAVLQEPFGYALWGGSEDRAERVTTMKRNVDLLPNALVPPASKRAIKAFLMDGPKPNGAMHIDISATPGLGPVRFLPFVTGIAASGANDDIWAMLRGVQVKVKYPAD